MYLIWFSSIDSICTLDLLCCPISFVLFVYGQSEVWFVGVTWPVLVLNGGGRGAHISCQTDSEPCIPVPQGQFSILNLLLLVFPFVSLETWGLEHHIFFSHFSVMKGRCIWRNNNENGGDQHKIWFKDLDKQSGEDSAEMRKLRLMGVTKTRVMGYIMHYTL